jgi:hypothetical protein
MATRPLYPYRILVYEDTTRTCLLVGQFESTIYPISACCRARAEAVSDHYFGDHWACANCNNFLGKRLKGPLAVNDFDKGPEGPHMVARAVAGWIGVDVSEIKVDIEPALRRTGSTGPR